MLVRRSRGRLLAAVAVVLIASACTPSGPAAPTVSPTPTPSPTYTCTALPSTTRCTPEVAASQKAQNEAVDASKSAYAAFLSEFNRLARDGGVSDATATMKMYAGGPYLAGYLGFLQDIKEKHQHYSGQIVNTKLVFNSGEGRTGSPADELTFSFCLDGRKNIVYNSAGKSLGTGSLIAGKIYTRRVDGSWKVWDQADKEVSSCPKG